MGAILGDGTAAQIEAAGKFGYYLGLCFQIVDDILDVTGDAASLGKTPGSDVAQGKTTTLSYMTIEQALAHATVCNARACEAVAKYENNGFLINLASYLLNRHR